MQKVVSQEAIDVFLHGEDPEEYIVGIEYEYQTNTIYKIIQHPQKGKVLSKDTFIPFLWVSDLTGLNFYKDKKNLQRKKIDEYGILIETLQTYDNERLENGMKYLVKSLKGYIHLINFFKDGGIDPWSEKYKKYFIILNPVEQYLIEKKKRLFKGIEDYNDVHRMVFDIETTGLDPEKNSIILIGIKDNRGFRKTLNAFEEKGEPGCIEEFFNIIKELKPSIIGGYNSASFDFPFILKRCEIHNINPKQLTQIFSLDGIRVKEGILKLANEIETYNQYVMWGFNIIDISHAVRRAQAINSEIKSWGLKYITKYLGKEKPNRIYVDGAFISKIYIENEDYYVNPKTGGYRKVGDHGTENLLTRYPGKYEIWSGKQIIEQYLDDDLYETMIVDESFSQSAFLLSKLVPTKYEKITTMGTATLWKIMMLAWSFDHKLAIPEKEIKRAFTGGLSRLLNVGYSTKIVKFDFSSLYPSSQIVWDIFPDCDVMGVLKSMLKYFRNIRISSKKLSSFYEKTNPELSQYHSRKQLPIKIFINSAFGAVSAPLVFPWGDINIGEMITCTGRQYLRMIIMYYMKRGYTPLGMDTDGVNFSMPYDIENHFYVGKGLNELVEKDKKYTGIYADTAEFNDTFMRDEMGLDIDYTAPACINLSRKNYILKKQDGKIKLTGNTLKSKNLQQYVIDFFNEGLSYLLEGNGLKFINLYYDYIRKIYNHEIPLSKIANKARVKQTAEDYKKYIQKTTKAGNLMARQAHMELILQSNYLATLGETIYYVNNGNKKTQGDVAKNPKTREIDINCYMLTSNQIEINPNMTGDYNVARYINIFNKRITPLLVVFKPEIRDDILIENPDQERFFTKLQCELINGVPLKEEGQDDLSEVMTFSDSEVIFWNKMQKDPYYMYIENTLSLVDQHWVEHNRKVLNFQEESIKNNDDEEIIETNGNDYNYDLVSDI